MSVPPLPGLTPPEPEPTGPPGVFDLLAQIGDPAAHVPAQEPPRPKPKRPKPDEAQVRTRIERAVSYWGDRDSRMDEDRQLYALSTALAGVDAFEQSGGEVVVRNLPYVTVEKVANMMAIDPPVLSVEAPSQDRTDDAEKVEALLRWLWERWGRRFRRTVQGSLQRAIAHYLCLRGWVAIRVHYDAEAPSGEVPVILSVVDPRNVYPMAGTHGIRYVVYKSLRTYAEVVDEFPEAEQVLGEMEDDQAVTLESYYDDYWHCVFADGKVVVPPQDHGYGFVPWTIAIAGGAPIRATADDSTSFVADVGPSIFHGIRRSFRQVNRVLSQLATEIARMSNPAKLYYYDPDENDEPQDIDLSPGATNYLVAPKEKVDVIRTSPAPSDVQPLLQILGDDLQRGSIPAVLWGIGDSGSSGFQHSLMAAAARDVASGVAAGIEQVYEDVSEMALRLLADHHTDPIGVTVRDRAGRWVVGHDVTPEVLQGIGARVHAEFNDVSPRDRIAFAQLAAQLSQSRLISLRTAREKFLNLENPDLENELVLEELIFQDEDLVKEYLTPLALAKFSPDLFQAWLAKEGKRFRSEQLAAQQANQQAAMAAAAPGLTGPPVPGMPPTPVPAPLGPEPFDAQAQAAGAAGVPQMPGIPGQTTPPIPMR